MTKIKIVDFQENLNRAMESIALNTVEAMKRKLTLEHGKDTGRLKSNIKYQITDNEIIISMPMHGKYLEYGTPPVGVNGRTKMPPVEELEGWAMRKLGDKKLAWALAYSIKKRGTRPFPFIRPTLDNDFPNILKSSLRKHFK